MLVISSREFREKQALYLDKVDNGEEVLVQRGKDKSYKIVPVTEDDTLMSKEEFFAQLDLSLAQKEQGKYTRVKNKEELADFLDSL